MGTTKKQLTTWEAACIITGYGIGAGVLSMPYMAARNGLILSTLILILSLLASYVLHLMIAEIALKEGKGGQIISCLNRFLFRGKTKQVLTVIFFVLMAVILVTNLAAYISGAEEIIVGLLPIPSIAAKLLFYAVAASVVLCIPAVYRTILRYRRKPWMTALLAVLFWVSMYFSIHSAGNRFMYFSY